MPSPMYDMWDAESTSRDSVATRGTSFVNLFVTSVPRYYTKDHLMELFAAFNPVSAAMMINSRTGTSKGYGFVHLASEECGRAAVAALHGTPLVHSPSKTAALCVSPSNFDGTERHNGGPRMYVRNIPVSTSEAVALAHFSQFGTVVALERSATLKPAGWSAVVVFATAAEARRAIEETHGQRAFGGGRRTPALVAMFERSTSDAQISRDSTETPRSLSSLTFPNFAETPTVPFAPSVCGGFPRAEGLALSFCGPAGSRPAGRSSIMSALHSPNVSPRTNEPLFATSAAMTGSPDFVGKPVTAPTCPPQRRYRLDPYNGFGYTLLSQ